MDQQNTNAIDLKTQPRALTQTLLLCCSIVGSIIFGLTYLILELTASNYNMMGQVIGDLELLKYGWVQSLNFMVLGLCTAAFAVGLRNELEGGFGSVLIPLSQALISVGAILMGIFIHEPVHTYASLIAFISLAFSFFLFGFRFGDDRRWRGWDVYSIVSAVLIMILLALFIFAKSTKWHYAGVFERLMLLVRVVWTIIFTDRIIMGRRLTATEDMLV